MNDQTQTRTPAPEQDYGTWRRARDGEWVVMAPRGVFVTAEERYNGTVEVQSKSGKRRTVRIGRYGAAFDVDGVAMAYGHTTDWGVCDDCGRRGRLTFMHDYSSGLPGFACDRCGSMATFG